MKRVGPLVVAALVAALLAGCTAPADDSPQPLTAEQAQSLALIRLNNFEAGTRTFVTSTLTDGGQSFDLDGYVDFRDGRGYANIRQDDQSLGVIVFDDARLAFAEGAIDDGLPPLPPPDAAEVEGWQTVALDPSQSQLHAYLAVLLSLSDDRPDNPLLLQQSAARYLGDRDLEGEEVAVMTGPGTEDSAESRFEYWIDDAGSLRRVDARIGAESITTTLGGADDVTLPPYFAEPEPTP